MTNQVEYGNEASALGALRLRWLALAVTGAGLVVIGTYGLKRIESFWYAAQWGVQAALVLGWECWTVWGLLGENRRAGEERLLSSLGAGNILSLARGVIIALLAGFLFLPRPEGGWAWLPATLYILSDFTDFFDGYAARKSNHVTRLGEKLDMNHDSIGVLTATLLAFQYGVAPWWYAIFGFARYFFVFGLWQRRRRGLPVFDLPPNPARRVFAALQMGLVTGLLFPIFEPPATTVAATAFMLPFLTGFVYDWLHVSGRMGQGDSASSEPWARLWKRMRDDMPVVVRLGLSAGLLALTVPAASRLQAPWGILEFICMAAIFMGWMARVFSVTGLLLLGWRFSLFEPTALMWALLLGYTAIIFLGPGRRALWGPEEWFVRNRAGE
ncbi:MAG: CDP-alcohol phosphatidyltransferase family protein [Anaerolineae bacterium]|nr:MAG: CDP-alcohol phosphatidyltransferase family protein [Anaerolineae bacterium]